MDDSYQQLQNFPNTLQEDDIEFIKKDWQRGGESTVHLARCKGEPVVIKELHFINNYRSYGLLSARQVQDLYKPGRMLAQAVRELGIHHDLCKIQGFARYMIELKGVVLGTLHKIVVPRWVVLSYATGGTLKEKMSGGLTAEEGMRYIHQIAAGLMFLHQHKVLHRDIKPANLFITANGDLIFGDFGYVKRSTDSSKFSGVSGTGPFTAPEYSALKVLSDKVDIFSFGVTVFELFGVDSTDEERSEKWTQTASQLPAPLGGFLLACVAHEAKYRPAAIDFNSLALDMDGLSQDDFSGMMVIGICGNPRCVARKMLVMHRVPRGQGINLGRDDVLCPRPLCLEHFTPLNVKFSKCEWMARWCLKDKNGNFLPREETSWTEAQHVNGSGEVVKEQYFVEPMDSLHKGYAYLEFLTR